ncbi:MAG: 2-amino-4-hydroxy-6-hydroxymethyldihydropteridine diphosphokinase [Acetobacteraceae bacterium]|nr:2-amino-4-hydroxy-6-hydroxymethyldihydropteridine diphosphokinase [Acetobacteraceae bacterium]
MILVAIGANLPGRRGAPPIETCRLAATALASLPGYRLRALSRWFETAPVPPSGQPSYINGVARLEGPVDPEGLLGSLQAIESSEGRIRSEPNAPRTLDLDIVAMGDTVRPAPDPVLPHPRAHLRAFVLVPLAEVAPEWVHPVLRRSVPELIASLRPQTIRAL